MYQHFSAKSGRQVLPRAGSFSDLPARRAGTVLHFVSIAGYMTNIFIIRTYMLCVCVCIACIHDGPQLDVQREGDGVGANHPRLKFQLYLFSAA